MNMKLFPLPTLLFFLLFLPLPIGTSDVHAKEGVIDPEPAAVGADVPILCQKLQISHTGVVCESAYGVIAHLDFPQVNLKSVIAGEQLLPDTESAFSVTDQVLGGRQYRNIHFVLRWQSATPEFLQMYLADIAPSWEGHGVPYRLLWRANYETCAAEECAHWTKVRKMGEYFPADIPDLPEDLAADSNFNGVPVSFWNTTLVDR